ncbi:MAG TPA: lipid ABC transporter permease/ATP-binding protein, partial [Gammaproteobacteria bacterium]|nr:lipid ABC transporter permease/ATP-binding protein [Gammaproteobacteria bacterium]
MVQTSKATSAMDIYRRLLTYALPHWPRYALAILGMAIYALTQSAFTLLMKPLLDKGILLHDLTSMKAIPLEVISLFLMRGVADFLAAYNIAWVGRSIIKRIRGETFAQLLQLPSG